MVLDFSSPPSPPKELSVNNPLGKRIKELDDEICNNFRINGHLIGIVREEYPMTLQLAEDCSRMKGIKEAIAIFEKMIDESKNMIYQIDQYNESHGQEGIILRSQVDKIFKELKAKLAEAKI